MNADDVIAIDEDEDEDESALPTRHTVVLPADQEGSSQH